MMTIEEKAQALNDYNECIGTEKRYWIEGNYYYVCYNALSAMDEIEEIDENAINKAYEKIKEK